METFKIPLLPRSKKRRSASPDEPSKKRSHPLPCQDILPLLSEDMPPPQPILPELPRKMSRILSFISVIKCENILYQRISSELGTANIDRVLKRSQRSDKLESIDHWQKVDKRLRLAVKEKWRNEDVRLGFRWNNTFLVKKYFTFGYRTPKRGTVHVYQTSATPIIYYEYDGRRLKDYRVRVKHDQRCLEEYEFNGSDRRFYPNDEPRFQRYVLQPHSIYRMKAGTTYIIITCRQTLFNCWVQKESSMNLRFARPSTDRSLIPDLSRGFPNVQHPVWQPPPPTPAHAIEEPPEQQSLPEQSLPEQIFPGQMLPKHMMSGQQQQMLPEQPEPQLLPLVPEQMVPEQPEPQLVPLVPEQMIQEQQLVYYVNVSRPEMKDAETNTMELPQRITVGTNTTRRCRCFVPPEQEYGMGIAEKTMPPQYSDISGDEEPVTTACSPIRTDGATPLRDELPELGDLDQYLEELFGSNKYPLLHDFEGF